MGLGKTKGKIRMRSITPQADDGKSIAQAHAVDRQHAALRELLTFLTSRMDTSHCWRKGPNGPRHLEEPFDQTKLNEHLFGGQSYGLCPIARGQSVTRAACLDLDNHDGSLPWETMVTEAELIAGVLESDGYPVHKFKSSGGNGVHLIIVWDHPQDAYSVRELLRQAVEACGYKLGTKGVAAQEVEAFPKQNEVAIGEAGSMWILPLSSGRGQPIGGITEWRTARDVAVLERPAKPERARTLTDTPELSRIKSALDAIPNDTAPLSYDDWFHVACAVHAATGGSDEGLALFEEFSARSSKHDEQFLRDRVWRYLKDRDDGITERTLFQMAAQHGGYDASIAADFDAIEAEPATSIGRFTFLQAAKFATGKPRKRWWIKRLIPAGEIIVVYGAPGSGKSFWVFDVVAAVARGVRWHSDHVTKQARVAYIFAEGAGGGEDRFAAYAKHHEIDLEDLDVYAIGAAPNLMTPKDVDDLIVDLKKIGPLGLVVCDTYAQMTAGGDENSSKDMGKAIAKCKALHAATGATIVLVAHSGKDQSRGVRGWSGTKGAVDAEIEITRDGDDRVATVTKIKDGAGEGDKHGFKLLSVPIGTDEDGDTVTSCVVTHMAVARHMRGSRRTVGDNERLVLDAMQTLAGIDNTHPSVEQVINEAMKQMPLEPGKRDRRREVLLRAITGLRDDGYVREVGRRLQWPENDE